MLRATRDGALCVFDWDNSGPADPSQELACVLFEFAGADPSRALTLNQAYRDAGGPGRIQNRGVFSMLIAQLGHLLQRHCRLWLDDISAADRAHRESEIAAHSACVPVDVPTWYDHGGGEGGAVRPGRRQCRRARKGHPRSRRGNLIMRQTRPPDPRGPAAVAPLRAGRSSVS